jgi:hypothetical protein
MIRKKRRNLLLILRKHLNKYKLLEHKNEKCRKRLKISENEKNKNSYIFPVQIKSF